MPCISAITSVELTLASTMSDEREQARVPLGAEGQESLDAARDPGPVRRRKKKTTG